MDSTFRRTTVYHTEAPEGHRFPGRISELGYGIGAVILALAVGVLTLLVKK